MQRVVVVGPCGSGKSTLARQIAAPLGLPLHHLDTLFWLPGWRQRPRDEFTAILRELIAGDRWLIDGNFSSTLALRLSAADTAIVLDLPRRIYLPRVLRRVATYYGRTRPDLAAGCPERLDWPFLRYVWRYHRDSRPKLLDTLSRFTGRIHWLRSRRDVSRFSAAVHARGTDTLACPSSSST